MNELKLYQVDAFASDVFKGNPAAVCPLTHWLSDEQLQAIAQENNLSETAFIVPDENDYHIRWFTPNTEVALCGHATLASAYVIFEFMHYSQDQITFKSHSGELQVKKLAHTLQMDFPALPYTPIAPSMALLNAISVKPTEIYTSTFDLLCIFDNESDVQNVQLDLAAISALPQRGIILSAPSTRADVYSRCFYPRCDVPEDPVTGSAHCVIAPYWCTRLNQRRIHAIQGSKRWGELDCYIQDDRVLLSGACHLYLEGTIYIPTECKV
jgi:PhzF family phenazine biosynthesis protein